MWKIFYKATFLIFAICFASSAFSFRQVPDKIIVDGAEYELLCNPLEDRYRGISRPKFKHSLDEKSGSGNILRGYIATWEIRDKRLFLVNVDAYIVEGKMQKKGIEVSRYKSEKIFASWYTGDLRIPIGDKLYDFNIGYSAKYKVERIISVKDGIVISDSEIKNQMPDKLVLSQIYEIEKSNFEKFIDSLKLERIHWTISVVDKNRSMTLELSEGPYEIGGASTNRCKVSEINYDEGYEKRSILCPISKTITAKVPVVCSSEKIDDGMLELHDRNIVTQIHLQCKFY